jgi:hypothetical protein
VVEIRLSDIEQGEYKMHLRFSKDYK